MARHPDQERVDFRSPVEIAEDNMRILVGLARIAVLVPELCATYVLSGAEENLAKLKNKVVGDGQWVDLP